MQYHIAVKIKKHLLWGDKCFYKVTDVFCIGGPNVIYYTANIRCKVYSIYSYAIVLLDTRIEKKYSLLILINTAIRNCCNFAENEKGDKNRKHRTA